MVRETVLAMLRTAIRKIDILDETNQIYPHKLQKPLLANITGAPNLRSDNAEGNMNIEIKRSVKLIKMYMKVLTVFLDLEMK